MTTTTSSPQARLVTVVVEVDPDLIDETAPTGLTIAGHIELRDAIGQVGTVAHIHRTARPVPAPPAVPVTNEKTRSYARRRLALENAMAIATLPQRGHLGTNAATIVAVAMTIEEYLEGKIATVVAK